jgi:hypothetical protein
MHLPPPARTFLVMLLFSQRTVMKSPIIQTLDDDALISPEAAAKFLNLGTGWLAKMRMSGGGPRYVKMGRRVHYRRCDLKAWIAQRLISSTSQQTAAARALPGQ